MLPRSEILEKPRPTQPCGFRVPSWRAGAAQREARSRKIFKSRHSWACGTTPPRWHPQRQRALLKAAADIEALRRCRGGATQGAARGDADHAQRNRALAQRLGDPMPEERGQGSKAERQAATPRSQPLSDKLEALEVRRRPRAATPGAPCPPAAPGWRRTRGEMFGSFFAPHTPPSRRPPRSHTADDRAVSPCRFSQLGEVVGHTVWCRRRKFVELDTRPSARPRSTVLPVGQASWKAWSESGPRCRRPSSRRGSRPTAVVSVLASGEKGVGEHEHRWASTAARPWPCLWLESPWPSRACRLQTRLLPTARPRALVECEIMPPPISTLSHFVDKRLEHADLCCSP